MLRLSHSEVVGTPVPSGISKVITSSDDTVIVAFSVAGEAAEVLAAQITEVLERIKISSSLELHQAIEESVEQALSRNLQISLAGLALIEEKTVCCTFSSSIFLKRGQKIGKILSSEEEQKIIEGNYRTGDTFVLSTTSNEEVLSFVQEELQSDIKSEQITEELRAAITNLPEQPSIALSIVTATDPTQDSTRHHSTTGLPEVKKPVFSFPSLQKIINTGKHLQGSLFSQDIYVRRYEKKKIARIVVPIACVVIVALATFVIFSSQRTAQLNEAKKIITPIDAQLLEIQKIVSQNPVQARQETEGIISNLEALTQKYKNEKVIASALQTKLTSVKEFYNGISGQEEFLALPTFFDLTLVQSGFIANTMKVNKDTIVFLDKQQKKVIALNIEKKQHTQLPIGEASEIRDIAFNDKELFILTPALYKFNLGSTNPATEVRANEDANAAAQHMQLFDTYLYVLNKEKHNIYRYTVNNDGNLSEAIGWVGQGQDVDFESVQSFAVDGDLWLSFNNGQVKKMHSGKEEAFSIIGLKDPFEGPISIFTNQDTQNLYILEPRKNRVVILNKKGEFLKEIKSSTLASTTTIVAQENLKKAFALSGSLVFEIALQ